MPSKLTCFGLARAGLLGNPSDGYSGKTISLTIPEYRAAVTLESSDHLEFLAAPDDVDRFDGLAELSDQIDRFGVYGGIRLLKAACKVFFDHASPHSFSPRQNVSISYSSNIPRSVGLAGSSAIIVATLKGLCEFYQFTIDPAVMATLAWQAETRVLGIPAGLQDRVIQSYGGVVYMDFAPENQTQIDGTTVGRYESLDPGLLPPLYVAFAQNAGEPTEVVHNDLRQRFERGDSTVVSTLKSIAELAELGKSALVARDHEQLHRLIDQNFDLRAQICQLNPFHREMIDRARSTGASAKFCGSGGAIIGTYRDRAVFEQLQNELGAIECSVFRPDIG